MAPPVETWIYLDIDGVLNVGVGDEAGSPPLLLNDKNCNLALQLADPNAIAMGAQEQVLAEKIACVARAVGNGETGTYMDFICHGKDQVSDVLVARLVQIIQAAGPNTSVVLASNWRQAKHQSKVRRLEARITRHLGREFTFDATTDDVPERSASDRLACIGDHLARYAEISAAERSAALRVLVLDDFFVTALEGWRCGRMNIWSEESVEEYLRLRVGQPKLDVRMVHCFDAWRIRPGLRVEVGTGLTAARLLDALEFLQATPLSVDSALASDALSTLSHAMSLSAETRCVLPTWSAGRERVRRLSSLGKSMLKRRSVLRGVSFGRKTDVVSIVACSD